MTWWEKANRRGSAAENATIWTAALLLIVLVAVSSAWLWLAALTLGLSAGCFLWLLDSLTVPSWWEGSDRLAPTYEEYRKANG